MNPQNGHVRGNILALAECEPVHPSGTRVSPAPPLSSQPRDKYEGRQESSPPLRLHCVCVCSKSERRKPDGNIGPRQTKDRADLPPLPQQNRHHEQDSSQRSEGTEATDGPEESSAASVDELPPQQGSELRSGYWLLFAQSHPLRGCRQREARRYWRRPALPVCFSSYGAFCCLSATTAEGRLSTAVSIATVKADGSKGRMCAA